MNKDKEFIELGRNIPFQNFSDIDYSDMESLADGLEADYSLDEVAQKSVVFNWMI